MSAALASASADFQFNGASIHLACSSPDELRKALATFGIGTVAANDAGGAPAGKSKPAAATAPAGAPASATAASSAQPAAAPAAQGDAGNATSGGQAAAASDASSPKPDAAPEVTFEQVKKAFLALSTKADGRAKCEKVLASFEPKLGRLSDAKPEQYVAALAAIEKASQ